MSFPRTVQDLDTMVRVAKSTREAAATADSSDNDRVHHLRGLVVHHRLLVDTLTTVEDIHRGDALTGHSHHGHIVLLNGEKNAGKTVIARLLAMRAHEAGHSAPTTSSELARVPVCTVAALGKTGALGLVSAIRGFYSGGHVFKRKTLTQLTGEAIEDLIRFGTTLLVINDLHYFREKDSASSDTASTIKALVELAGITVVGTTVPDQSAKLPKPFNGRNLSPHELAQSVDRMKVLPVGAYKLRKYSADANEMGLDEWATALAQLECELLLRNHPQQHLAQHAFELHELSGGLFGRVANTLVNCAMGILDQPDGRRECIELADLRSALVSHVGFAGARTAAS